MEIDAVPTTHLLPEDFTRDVANHEANS